MPIYSEKVMDHFTNPRNVGEIENADGIGEVGNPVCGDMMTFYIKVKDNRLEDVKYKTFGCGAAIAVSSMVRELAKGKTLEEAMEITPKSVAEELHGLPQNKFHCSNLGAQALHLAIEDYRKKQKAGEQAAPHCPYCDAEGTTDDDPLCQACKTTVEYCPHCGAPLAKDEKTCSSCGH